MSMKEVTVFVLDCAQAMRRKYGSRDESDLDYALDYVRDVIGDKILLNRKTVFTAVIATGLTADGTPQVLMPIVSPSVHSCRELAQTLNSFAACETSDYGAALSLAEKKIEEHAKKQMYLRRIIFITNAKASMPPMTETELLQLKKDFQTFNTTLECYAIDLELSNNSSISYADTDPVKMSNESQLQSMCQVLGSTLSGFNRLHSEIAYPKAKVIKPVAGYKGTLQIGDLHIEVVSYPAIRRATPLTATTAEKVEGQDEKMPIKAIDEYYVHKSQPREGSNNDAAAQETETAEQDIPVPQRETIFRDEIQNGYLFGREIVSLSDAQLRVAHYQSPDGLNVLGFMNPPPVWRYTGEADFICAQKENASSAVSISSLCEALLSTKKVILARYQKNERSGSHMVTLSPVKPSQIPKSLRHDGQTTDGLLVLQYLPFADDVSLWQFPSLDYVQTKGGSIAENHHTEPTDDMYQLMDKVVDEMELVKTSQDAVKLKFRSPDLDPSAIDLMPLDFLYNPLIHRISQAIKSVGTRISNKKPTEESEVPPLAPELIRYKYPIPELLDAGRDNLKRLSDLFEIQPVPKKQDARSKAKASLKGRDDLDIESLLSG